MCEKTLDSPDKSLKEIWPHMIRLCITGVPGTGKSTVCKLLNEMGFECHHLSSISERLGCVDNDIVDVDCLNAALKEDLSIAESHYSHLLNCNTVVILECETSVLRSRLKDRGYTEEKIAQNVEAQDSDVIFYETLERLPSTNIIKINTTHLEPEQVVARLRDLL